MTKPRSARAALEEKLDQVGIALLESAYGGKVEEGEDISLPKDGDGNVLPPDPKVFNAVVNWIRVKNGLEPSGEEESGLDKLTRDLNRGKR